MLGVPEFEYEDLPEGVDGYYCPDSNRIFVNRGLNRRREVSVVTHEYFHKYFRHQRLSCPARHNAREVMVEDLAAKHLISFPMLLDGLRKHDTMEGLAREWGVDYGIIYSRITRLSPIEYTILEVCMRHCNLTYPMAA